MGIVNNNLEIKKYNDSLFKVNNCISKMKRLRSILDNKGKFNALSIKSIINDINDSIDSLLYLQKKLKISINNLNDINQSDN